MIYVKVYRTNGDGRNWVQIGQTFSGNATEDYFGYSVDISADGMTIICGYLGDLALFDRPGNVEYPVPLTDVCFSHFVHSGNDGCPRVVPWGTSMSLHSAVSCANIYMCLRLCASESGTYVLPHTRNVSIFPLPPTAQ